MENKQKPSALMFFSEHDFKGKGVPYSPEMLNWPFFGGRGEVNEEPLLTIYRRAIRGLVKFTQTYSNFRASMSLEADPTNKKFIFAHRTWAEIYLNDDCVLVFSHDTRYNNHPFNSLCQWPELHKERNTDKDWEDLDKILFLWSSDKWAAFFKKRLKLKGKNLIKKAQAKKQDALTLERRAEVIFSALNLNKQSGA